MSERFKVILAYTVICTIWGSTWLVIKVGLETMTPLLSAGLRFAVAGVVLFAIIRLRNIVIPWNSKTALFFFTVSLTSFSIPFALVYWGEQHVSSGLTSILFAVFPFCVAVISFFMLPNEKLTLTKIVGIIFGFTGIVVIFSNDVRLGTGTEQIVGMVAIVTSALIQAFSAVLVKKHAHDISPFVVSFIPMSFAGIFLTLGGLLFEDLSVVQFTPTAIFSVLFLAVFGSVTTFVSYFWLLKKVEVVLLSLTSFITPIIAVFLGALILNESVSSHLLLGSSLVLGGILAANSADVRIFLRNRFTTK